MSPKKRPSPRCQKLVGKNKKCGKPAEHSIRGEAEIFGKMISVTFQVCEDHISLLKKKDDE